MRFSEGALLFDLLTRDALLVWNRGIHKLDGPFESNEHAVAAVALLKGRQAEDTSMVCAHLLRAPSA